MCAVNTGRQKSPLWHYRTTLSGCIFAAEACIDIPNKASIFRAELHAISLALSLIRRSKEKKFIIFSDSMSSLEAISGFKLEIDIVQNIIKDYTNLANTGKTIILCWIVDTQSCQYSWQ